MYILSNFSMTMYTGVTNNLATRAMQHKAGTGSSFTSRYHFDRIVYYEVFELVVEAIAREKTIKAMSRTKKIALVKAVNPRWEDLLAKGERE
ncbi:MAG TPA: GIY-YIG nuclease family protein [Thermoanaerobaculia bacterium]|nr:GIY-YIG nuclease family protein [Thermoanaerobaculia bacterium]